MGFGRSDEDLGGGELFDERLAIGACALVEYVAAWAPNLALTAAPACRTPSP